MGSPRLSNNRAPLPSTTGDRDAELVQQTGREILLHSVRTAADRHVLVTGGCPGLLESSLDSICDEDLDNDVLRVERQLADDDRRRLDVKTANALRELPLYPRLRRVLSEHKLASAWTAKDDVILAAAHRKPKDYRNVLRALGEAVAEAKIQVTADERLSPHSLRHTYTSHLIVGLELDASALTLDLLDALSDRRPDLVNKN